MDIDNHMHENTYVIYYQNLLFAFNWASNKILKYFHTNFFLFFFKSEAFTESTNLAINYKLCQYSLATITNHPIITQSRNGG